jgi:hypothetical protein
VSLPESPPPRLVETEGPAGDCLRQALAASPPAPELPPFSALRDRRQRRLQRQLSLGALLSAIALLLGVRAVRRDDEAPSVRAELAAAAPRERDEPSQSPAPTDRAEPTAGPELQPLSTPPEPSRKLAPETARPRARPASARLVPKRPVEGDGPKPGAPHRSARACAELARDGAAEQALACYAELANGSGITAELALFEQARLEGKALRRPEQALRTLDSYRRRFPNGSLRAEVMLAQIDWLLRAGERARALQLVDEALASGSLQERRAELERLRETLSSP